MDNSFREHELKKEELEMQIEEMKILLRNPGKHSSQEYLWNTIEKYKDIKKRLRYRQIFFLAGGEICLTEFENKILEQLKRR